MKHGVNYGAKMRRIPRLTKPISLIGMMGSGKSTVGKLLAKRLGVDFYDSDRVIEIRDEKGQQYVAQREREIISEVLTYGKAVLSTGGNSFIDRGIRELLLRNTYVIWLRADFNTLYKRISRRDTRYEFNLDDADIKVRTLENMLKQREHIYSMAHITVDNLNQDVESLVNLVLDKIIAIASH